MPGYRNSIPSNALSRTEARFAASISSNVGAKVRDRLRCPQGSCCLPFNFGDLGHSRQSPQSLIPPLPPFLCVSKVLGFHFRRSLAILAIPNPVISVHQS